MVRRPSLGCGFDRQTIRTQRISCTLHRKMRAQSWSGLRTGRGLFATIWACLSWPWLLVRVYVRVCFRRAQNFLGTPSHSGHIFDGSQSCILLA